MEKGNVLVIGNSGVGKSTLIDAVLERNAEARMGSPRGWHMNICENDKVPFKLIDTQGVVPSSLSRRDLRDMQINVVWFCMDGTSSNLFSETIEDLLKATDIWKSVPVIVVITKSYSVPDRKKNIEMVRNAFDKHSKGSKKPREIIPVIAYPLTFFDEMDVPLYVPSEGISELVDITNSLMPDGKNPKEIVAAIVKALFGQDKKTEQNSFRR